MQKNILLYVLGIVKYIWVLFLVCIPFLYFVLYKVFQKELILGAGPNGGEFNYSYIGIQWLGLISSIGLFGALGATASYMARLKEISEYEPIFLPQIFGVIFAAVLALVFLGGLVSGSLFPDFSGFDRWAELNIGTKDWAKLLVWCFIAGFFERFVPDILKSLVKSRNDNER